MFLESGILPSPYFSESPVWIPAPGGGGGGFTPPDLGATLKFWIDASQIVGKSDGDSVSALSDLSGNGNDPTIGTNFTYKTGILNGLPVLRAPSGVGSYMTLPDFSSFTAATMLIVFRNGAGSNGNTIWNLAGSADDPATYLPLSGGGGSYDAFFSTTRKNNFASGITNQWNVYCVRSAASDWTAHVNGVSKFSTGTNTVSAPSAGAIGRVSLGAPWGDASGDREIAEIIICDSALGSTDQGNAEAYLATKWGL